MRALRSISAFEVAADDGVFAGAVLVIRNGVTVLNRGYGYSDDEETIQNKETTLFAIGSVPIDFTNAAILMLSERGKLKLDDTVSKHPEEKVEVMRVVSGSPAFVAGLRPTMRVNTIDGKLAEANFQALLTSAAEKGKAIVLVVEADGVKQTLKSAPRRRK